MRSIPVADYGSNKNDSESDIDPPDNTGSTHDEEPILGAGVGSIFGREDPPPLPIQVSDYPAALTTDAKSKPPGAPKDKKNDEVGKKKEEVKKSTLEPRDRDVRAARQGATFQTPRSRAQFDYRRPQPPTPRSGGH